MSGESVTQSLSHPQLQDLVQHLDAIVWQLDHRVEQFTFVSERAEATLGYPVKQWLEGGLDFFRSIVHPDDRDAVLSQCDAATRRGEDHVLEYRVITADGRTLWLCDSVRVTCNRDGSHICHGVMIDVTRQHEAEEALRASESRFEAFVNNNPAAAWICDAEGRLLYISDPYTRIFGLKREDLVGKRIIDVFPPEQGKVYQQNVDRVIETGQPIEVIEPTPRPDGKQGFSIVFKFPLEGSDGRKLVGGTAIDITERKQAEETLQQSEKHLRGVLDSLPVFIAVLDPEGQVLHLNRTGNEAVGTSTEEDRGKHFSELKCWKYSKAVSANIRDALARAGRGQTLRYDVPCRLTDGRFMTVDFMVTPMRGSDGQITHLICSGIDVTERRLGEKALRRREQEFKALVENAPDVIVRWDRQFRHRYVNPTVERVTGLPPEALVGKSIRESGMPDELAKLVEPRLQQVFAERREVDFEFSYPSPGGMRYFECRLVPELSADGTVESVMGISRDVTEAKQTREALWQSRERLVAALRASETGTYRWDLDSGRIDLDEGLARLLGLSSPCEVTEIDQYVQCVHPEDRQRVADGVRSSELRGTDFEQEYRVVWPDGSVHWLSEKGKVYTDEQTQHRYMAGACVCVTLRREAEQALVREHETVELERRRLQAVLDVLPVGVLLVDAEGELTEINAAGRKMWGGAKPLETLDQRWQCRAWWPESGKAMHREDWGLIRAVREGEATIGREIDIQCLDGMRKTILGYALPVRDAENRIVGAVAVNVDITDRKAAERQLREEEQRLTSLINSMPDLVTFKDGQGRWMMCNDFVRKVFRLQDVDYRGQKDSELAEHSPFYADALRYCEYSDEEAWHKGKVSRGEEVIPQPDGAEQIFDVIKVPLFNPDGTRNGLIVVGRDITARKRAEDQLTTLNETLEQRVAERTAVAEQRATLLRTLAGELTQTEQRERRRLAQILHDHLQQLLAAAKMRTTMMRERTEGDEQVQALRQVEELLSQSIDASRSLTVELSPPILYESGLVSALEWLSRWMRERHDLTVTVEADEQADPHDENVRVLLFEAVRELLFNVTKHAQTSEAWVTVTRTKGGEVRVVVEDAGKGFDTSVLSRSERPEGFGLFSIRERLALLGGRMMVQSEPGEGTCITLLAPLTAVQEPEALEAPERETKEAEVQERPVTAPAPDGATLKQTGTIRVLLADDHKILREGVAALLNEEPDIEVVAEAADGQMAVEMALQTLPDVVVMDITMPKLNGIEATRRITHELPQTRVIGLSIHEEEDMAEAMRDAGAAAYLSKAGKFDVLISCIRGWSPLPTQNNGTDAGRDSQPTSDD